MTDELLREPMLGGLPFPDLGIERIDRVAVFKDAIVYSLPRPARHHNVLQAMYHAGIDYRGSEQGFVTSVGRWVSRKPALRLAREAGQVIRETAPAHGLFSEDMW